MKIKNRACIGLIVILPLVALASDENHLVPEDSVFSEPYNLEYEILVSRFFAQHLTWGQPRMVVLPSFQNEYALEINSTDVECTLAIVQASNSLWTHVLRTEGELEDDPELVELFATFPDDPLTLSIIRYEAKIDNSICNRVISMWRTTLLDTKYRDVSPSDEIAITVDGISYHFSMWMFGNGVVAGMTHSPVQSTIPGMFVELGKALTKYTREPTPQIKAEVLIALVALESSYE